LKQTFLVKDKEYHLAMHGWRTSDAANKLLQAAGKDSSLIAAAYNGSFKAVSLSEKLTTTLHIKTER